MAGQIGRGERTFRIVGVFRRAFSTILAAPLSVFGVSFLFAAIPVAVWTLILPNLMAGLGPEDSAQVFAIGTLDIYWAMTFNTLAQGAQANITAARAEGRTVSIGQAINNGLAMGLPLLGLGMLTWLGVILGSALLVVPGLLGQPPLLSFGVMLGAMPLAAPGIALLLIWCVAPHALVNEGTGIKGALARSRYLTKGALWKMFGILVILIVMLEIILAGAVVLAPDLKPDVVEARTMAGGMPPAHVLVAGLITNTLTAGFMTAVFSSAFIELRHWKDGHAAA